MLLPKIAQRPSRAPNHLLVSLATNDARCTRKTRFSPKQKERKRRLKEEKSFIQLFLHFFFPPAAARDETRRAGDGRRRRSE